MSGVQVQPCCCANPFQPCARCNNSKGPIYFKVVLTGIVDSNPTDCPACAHYNSATFTLQASDPFVDGSLFCPQEVASHQVDPDACCWRCFISVNSYECLGVVSSPGMIALKVSAEYAGSPTPTPTGNYFVTVDLGGGLVIFEKSYSALPDCRGFVDESIPWSSNGSGRCSGSGSSTCLVTALTSVSDPCCRDICYPDETPGPITVVVTNIQDIGCGSCSSLNATYVVQRQVEPDSQGHCYIARFAETCGFDSLAIQLSNPAPVGKFFHSSDPSGTSTDQLIFNISPATFSAPYAECDQFDGAELRSTDSITSVCRAGNGAAYDAGDPATYAKMTLSF